MNFEAENVPVEKLPKPAGWRLLIAPVKIKDTSEGGIFIPDESVKTMEYFRNVAKVIAMGNECYKHPKFNGGTPIDQRTPKPWISVGDIISYSSYTGAEITVQYEGELSRLKVINDDEVVTVITDLSVLNFL